MTILTLHKADQSAAPDPEELQQLLDSLQTLVDAYIEQHPNQPAVCILGTIALLHNNLINRF